MFGISVYEMGIILVLALIVLGPKKLPDIAKALGKAFNEFKKATNDFKESMGVDNELQNVKSAFDEINRDIKETIDLKPSQTDTTTATAQYPEIKNEPDPKDTDKPSDAE